MLIAHVNRGRFGLLLAGLCVCCLPLKAASDEFKYLVDDAQIIMSVDLAAASKTKTFQEFLELMKKVDPKGEADESKKKAFSNIARLTLSNSLTDNGREIASVTTTVKPMTVDEVKEYNAPFMTRPTRQKNRSFTTVKYGGATIYQETYQFEFSGGKLSPPMEGMTFFIDGKYVVTGSAMREGPSRKDAPIGEASIALLKKIIDRKKDAALSPTVKAALKQVGMSKSPAYLVVDFQALPAKAQKDTIILLSGFATSADIKANFARAKGLLVTLSEPAGKLKMSATLMCTDTAAAGVVKGIGERTLADI